MSLRTTLLIAFAYALLIVIVILEVPLVLNVDRRVDAEIKAEANGQAQLIATTASDQLGQGAEIQQLVRRSGQALGGRVIVVTGDAGRIVADSAGPGLRGRAYSERPEIARALRGQAAQGKRRSASLGEELLFTAVPIIRNGQPIGAVRVTQSVAAVNAEVRNDALALVAIGAAALVLGLGVAWVLAGFLSRPLGALATAARRVSGGELQTRVPARGPREQRELAESFNEMTARLSRVLDAQRDFVANASHQLRTPLTGLRLRLEAVASRSPDPAVMEEVQAADAEIERLAALLNNLLTLAQEGQARPAAHPVDLAKVARAAGDRWEAEAEERGQQLELRGAGSLVVPASADDLGIVLDNLLENAIKYSPRGTTVKLEWTPASDREGTAGSSREALLAVSDEGQGLDSTEASEVFGRFYRGRAASGKPGTGLGLAIVELLLRRWDGSIQLTNRAQGGLRAEIRLPAMRPAASRAEPLPPFGPDFDKT